MTIRTFWTILLRILGLYLLLQSLTIFAQFLPFFSNYGEQLNPNVIWVTLTFIYPLFTIGLYFSIMTLIIYKSDWIIDKLKLDSGIEERTINLNFESSSVLTITTIIVGALIFADGFPFLCRQLFVYFQEKFSLQESPTTSWIVYYFIKTVIGYYLMTNSKTVIDFINNQKTGTNNDNK